MEGDLDIGFRRLDRIGRPQADVSITTQRNVICFQGHGVTAVAVMNNFHPNFAKCERRQQVEACSTRVGSTKSV